MQVCNLQLEGYSFESGCLVESRHDSPSVITLPPCVMGWVSPDTPPPYHPQESIPLPVYASENREKLVIQVDVPCGNANQEAIVQAGAAIFLKSL